MAEPSDSPAHKLAGKLLGQQQTALVEQGQELGSQYQISHAEQAKIAEKISNHAVSDREIGELSRLMEQEDLTSAYEVDKVSARGMSPSGSTETDNKETNYPNIISGNKTRHAEERLVERGLSEKTIADAISNPMFVGEVVVDEFGRKSVRYIGADVTVVLNPDTGDVITIWKTGSRMRKKYGGKD